MADPTENTPPQNDHVVLPDNVEMPEGATPPDPAEAATPQGVSIPDIVSGFKLDLGDSSPIVPLNRDGTPKRKPGRPRKIPQVGENPAPAGDNLTAPSQTPKTPATRKANRVASDELARAILNLSVGGLSALVGPEWNFQSPEEAQGMKQAVSAYIEAKGDGQLSPEALLALVVASYAVPRFAEENTRSKLGAFFSGLWNGFKSLFKR